MSAQRGSDATEPLHRQTSVNDAALAVAGVPEIERCLSILSNRDQAVTGVKDVGSTISEGTEKDGTDKLGDGREKEEEGQVPAVVTFPDGGVRAWLVVVGAFWTVFCGFGLSGAIGGFQTLYTSMFPSYNDSQIAWITSVQAFVTFSLACFSGALFDKCGHRPLIAGGTFSLTLGFCMLSLCTQYWQVFIVHATLIAWGCNLLFICPMGVLGQWFMRRRGLAFGLMSTGSSLGAVIWPLILADLPGKIGFAWTCRVMALLTLFCGVLAFFLLKTRLPPKPPGAFFYKEAFKNFEYVCVVANFWTFSFGFFAFMAFIGTYGQAVGLGDFAPYLLIIQNACSAVGRLGSGIAADRIGIYNTNIISSIVITAMFWVWLACKTATSCIVLVVIIGVAGGAYVSLQAPTSTKTATDMRYGGTMVGQALFVQSFSQLICGPIFGALLGTGSEQDRLHNFARAICLGAAMMVVATGFMMMARWKSAGWTLRART
ncbi:hypothetical protein JCM24511_09570 [Saitozyma sp. JCM 24511]|nr:hypothetical protein JCM24511_09570 [Saitozyma sp. JCM 24511]